MSTPTEYAQEVERIRARRLIAAQLAQQAANADSGTQMAGRIAIARSPLEGLAQLAQSYQSNRIRRKSESDEAAVTAKRAAETQAALAKINDPNASGAASWLREQEPQMVQGADQAAKAQAMSTLVDSEDLGKAQVIAQMKAAQPAAVGDIDPDKFTPESLQKYQQSHNMADLVAREKPVNPANLQHTETGLVFDPETGQYKDPATGKVYSADEVQQRHIDQMARAAGATESARGAAKLKEMEKQLGPDSIDFQAEYFEQNNKLFGSSRNPRMLALVAQRLHDRAIERGDTVAASLADAKYKAALGPAMTQTTKQLSANENFLETMHRNIANADALAKKVDKTGVPIINEVFNAWRRKTAITDPEMRKAVAAFDVWNTNIVGESAKISTGGVGSVTATSDTQIEKNAKLLSTAQNYDAWRSAADAMQQEGMNRIGAIKSEADKLRAESGGQLTPVGGGLGSTAPPPAARPAGETAAQRYKRLKDGG